MACDQVSDNASLNGQSKRPAINHRESDSQSDTTTNPTSSTHRTRHHTTKQQLQTHHVSRMGTRVSSSKALHKQGIQQQAAASSKLARLAKSPQESKSNLTTPDTVNSYRRANSEVKLPRNTSTGRLPKSASQTSVKRNRSQPDISKRNKSAEKLKQATIGHINSHRPKSSKGQVHFALGDDDVDEDEWVDASGSNSPYVSRKGSFNSSGQSSARPSATNSRPQTPKEETPAPPQVSTPDRQRTQHKEYLTSRLLRRIPSAGAPPQMTTDVAVVTPHNMSPTSIDQTNSTAPSSSKDELTSRFVDAHGSGITSQGSFYHHPQNGSTNSGPSSEAHRRPQSTASFPKSSDSIDGTSLVEPDDSTLVPRAARRRGGPWAETSRTQQKLNLQRASSVIEPGQVAPGVTGAVGSTPLIGVGGPGHDGGYSKDPRVGKLLERTGMEYLVVRRYQNPILRSFNRLSHLPGLDHRTIPRSNTGSTIGKRSLDLPLRAHSRKVSASDSLRPLTPTPGSRRTNNHSKTNGIAHSVDGEGDSRGGSERLSGSSLVGEEEEVSTATLLRNMWEKSTELSASTD